MKRVLSALVLLIGLWVIGSAIFQWPPLSHYVGESGNACMNNLRQIDGAKQQWCLETGHTNGATVTRGDIATYVTEHAFRCPSGGTYSLGAIGEDPTCSLGSTPPPPGVRERVGLFGWRWKVWPSSMESHSLPKQ